MGDMYADPAARHPSIASIEFGTASELSARSVDVPQVRSGDDLLCMVTLHGTFKMSGPPPGDKVFTYKLVIMAFDGRTGNLLRTSLGDLVK